MIFMSPDLTPKFTKPIPPVVPGGGFGVHRLTLREILLTDLLGDVQFGRECVGYEENRDGVIVHFADGSYVEGDLLVGADGTGSAIRRQLIPDAEIDELNWAIYGRTPITPELLVQTPGELVDSFNRVLGPDGSAISIATCRSVTPTSKAVVKLAPRARLTETPDYFSWTVTVTSHRPVSASPVDLHRIATDAVAGWHTGVVRIVADADVAATFLVPITSARPVRPWHSRCVTLLGDAIHTMSPGRGDGANVALRDALQLRDALAGSADWPVAKRAYEEEMLAYGFAAVQASRQRPFAPSTGPRR
jgi:2-polyprenyl-6-methoxyphenol hydroxylase-like FAD-dependent oxidoreductase